MPQVSKLTELQWSEVRGAMMAGLSYKEVSERYEVEEYVIRKRASREQWPLPSRVKEEAERIKSERLAKIESHGKVTTALLADTLQERAESYSLQVFDKVSKLSLDGLKSLQAPQNWKEQATADQIARRAAGLDKPQTQVNIAFGGIFRSPDQAGIVLNQTNPSGEVGDEQSQEE